MTVLEQAKTRALVVDALDGLEFELPDGRVQLVRAFPTMPPAPQPLDAWPQWDRTEWINPWAQRTTWNAVVILPQGMPADVALDDAVATYIGAALAQKIGGVVGPAQPIGIRLQDAAGPTVPAVSVTFVV